jgi:hypothetical protein
MQGIYRDIVLLVMSAVRSCNKIMSKTEVKEMLFFFAIFFVAVTAIIVVGIKVANKPLTPEESVVYNQRLAELAAKREVKKEERIAEIEARKIRLENKRKGIKPINTLTIAVFYSDSHVDTLKFQSTKKLKPDIADRGGHFYIREGNYTILFRTNAFVKILEESYH